MDKFEPDNNVLHIKDEVPDEETSLAGHEWKNIEQISHKKSDGGCRHPALFIQKLETVLGNDAQIPKSQRREKEYDQFEMASNSNKSDPEFARRMHTENLMDF